MSPPPESLTWTVWSSANSPVTSRNGTPAVVPSTRQGPASVWPSMRDVLGKELIGAAGLGVCVVTRSCAIAQILERPVRPRDSPDSRSGGKRQPPSGAIGTRISARPIRVS